MIWTQTVLHPVEHLRYRSIAAFGLVGVVSVLVFLAMLF